MFIYDKRKEPYYLDYFEVKKSCSFTKISDENVIDYLSKIEEYINKYKEQVYSYIFVKDFILGLSLSIDKKEVNITTLKNINSDILKLSDFRLNSPFYKEDTPAKKEYLDEAFSNILSQTNKITPKSSFNKENTESILKTYELRKHSGQNMQRDLKGKIQDKESNPSLQQPKK